MGTLRRRACGRLVPGGGGVNATDRETPRPRVMRVAHHAVVSAWRDRERGLRALGARVELFSARRWNEGGRETDLDPEGERWVHGVATLGSHPNAFVYDPRRLWRGLRARPDILDLHEEPFALATAEILALRGLAGSRAPYILYSAQNIEKRYPLPFRWFERYALRHAAGAYVCNVEAGEILRRKGLRGPAALIPLGVDVDRFSPRERSAPGDRPVVGYVGRLERHKGVDVLLRAAAVRPTWHLRITGDGPAREELHALAVELGIIDRVDFLGFAAGADLAERYRELDVLAVPSRPVPGWLEQFCRVAVEAMASGVPVVASRSGAIPDVVGESGVLVEPDDPDLLAAGVDSSLASWTEFRAQGLAASQEYTWERVAVLHEELYRRVVPGRDSGADAPPQVVVVAYGPSDLLRGALEALEGRFPLTIVDNSSLDETAALAAEHGAVYVDAGSNIGFGAAVNVALDSLAKRGLEAQDVLLLNPDARISPAAVTAMHAHLHASRDRAAVGATQTEPGSNEPVRVWWPFPSPARAWLEAIGLGRFNRAHGFAIGSVLMLRSEAIADVGRFDERFFLYAEEVDWQRRAVNAGWTIHVAPVTATHIGAGTSTNNEVRERLFHASAQTYQRKHFGPLGWRIYQAAVVAGSAARAVLLPGDSGRAARRRLQHYASVAGPL